MRAHAEDPGLALKDVQDVDGGGLWPRSSILPACPLCKGVGAPQNMLQAVQSGLLPTWLRPQLPALDVDDEDGRGDRPLPPLDLHRHPQPKLTPQPPTVPMLGPMAGATTHRPLKSLRQRPIRPVLPRCCIPWRIWPWMISNYRLMSHLPDCWSQWTPMLEWPRQRHHR